jgi:hypothetical protein
MCKTKSRILIRIWIGIKMESDPDLDQHQNDSDLLPHCCYHTVDIPSF